MSKKDDIHIHLHTDKKPAKKEEIISIGFIICDWKNEFSDYQCSVMIAEALNYCVYHHHLKIVGYLIAERRVCLVLKADPAHVNELLQFFYKELKKEILHHTHHRSNNVIPLFDKTEITEKQLFIRYPLLNYMLIKLITGRKVHLPYYNPHLARLQEKINHSDFCSAIDYSGAIGPVVVKVLDPIEFHEYN